MADSEGGFITHLIQDLFAEGMSYINPADTEEDDETTTEYVTEVRYLGALHDTKYILVNEMPNYFTDEELNVAYHHKEEYERANYKYGYIFKHQKFDNADTVEKLEEYATDWIKNNYYNGLTSFEITALDMHLLGEDVDPYLVGDQIDVYYPEPEFDMEVHRTLTCISAEYDLHNPDKTKYKIGIPDTALNKVYGETTKSGGGGGGGNNNEEENDEEDDKEGETVSDKLSSVMEYLDENGWSFFSKIPAVSDVVSQLFTPHQRDSTNPFTMSLTADYVKTGDVISSLLTLSGVSIDGPTLQKLKNLVSPE